MAIVTLLTDSGESDHYVASIKGRIISSNPEIRIIDISHKIQPCDIGHAAFVLRSVFKDFPKGTVHLIGVDATGNKGDVFVALALEDHFFVGPDNGFFGLLSEQLPAQIIQLGADNAKATTFPEREVFAAAAAKLANGTPLTELGNPLPAVKRLIDRQVKATKKQITGNVIRVDNFGNLITNIPKVAFDVLSKNKAFTIQFGGEKFRRIHTGYNQTEEGECFILFNSLDLLEIGIYKGNASELLGLAYDSVVNIIFED
ncbi:SAM hydrolase/SAM-dependent halogenase family protein [Chryseosolibacter indicus]|uniref:SAM-dependent chlorinase/fluorinase n=1 Tax=Chryseosolibacter indicus TaxID=2782351 RepID=A0ABS5VP17_9BACT|nr:SAM-dependent chlorinase/fluorinase [Chryseosolibacter indicus]MBT1702529.1 SAM-dependent chlorinase/fluorinase [Chryseosolibacter indicus]